MQLLPVDMLLSCANYHVVCYRWLVLTTNLTTTMKASFLLFSLVTRLASSTRGVIPSSDFWLKWDTPSEQLHTLGLFLGAGWVWFFLSVHNAAESSTSAVFARTVIDTWSSLACEVFFRVKILHVCINSDGLSCSEEGLDVGLLL